MSARAREFEERRRKGQANVAVSSSSPPENPGATIGGGEKENVSNKGEQKERRGLSVRTTSQTKPVQKEISVLTPTLGRQESVLVVVLLAMILHHAEDEPETLDTKDHHLNRQKDKEEARLKPRLSLSQKPKHREVSTLLEHVGCY